MPLFDTSKSSMLVAAKFKTGFFYYEFTCVHSEIILYIQTTRRRKCARTKIAQITHHFVQQAQTRNTHTQKTIEISASAVTLTLVTYFFSSKISTEKKLKSNKNNAEQNTRMNKQERKENVSKLPNSTVPFYRG